MSGEWFLGYELGLFPARAGMNRLRDRSRDTHRLKLLFPARAGMNRSIASVRVETLTFCSPHARG